MATVHTTDSSWVWDQPPPSASVLQSVSMLVVLVLAAGALFLPWVVAGGVGDVGTRSAIAIPVLNVVMVLLVLAATVANVVALVTGRSMRPFVVAPLSIALLPALAIIVTAELLRSVLPTWATPIVTNSDVVTLRGGTGVWLFGGLAAVALALTLMPRSSLSVSGRAAQVLLGARGAVAVTALVVATLRAQPFYRFSTSAEVIEETDPLGFRVGIQIGDIPALGTFSLIGVIAITAAAGWILVRPHPVAVILAGTGAMMHLLSIWAAEVVRRVASLVVPSGWSPFDEADGAVTMSLTPAIGLSVLATVSFLVAVAASSWPIPNYERAVTSNVSPEPLGLGLPNLVDDLP